MLLHGRELSDNEYIILLFVLNVTQDENALLSIDAVLKGMKPLQSERDVLFHIQEVLAPLGLVELRTKGNRRTQEAKRDGLIGLTWQGLAFLINYAEYYLARIRENYDEVPEKLIASLLRFIDLSAVPAADRYVSVTDNLPEFKKLEDALTVIYDAIVRDQNADELPIPNKRDVLADIEGVRAQIKSGAVRLSDLVSRIRPMVQSIAEVCKDIAVIAGAATAAYMAISNIITKLF
jgi:hypothetical protein